MEPKSKSTHSKRIKQQARQGTSNDDSTRTSRKAAAKNKSTTKNSTGKSTETSTTVTGRNSSRRYSLRNQQQSSSSSASSSVTDTTATTTTTKTTTAKKPQKRKLTQPINEQQFTNKRTRMDSKGKQKEQAASINKGTTKQSSVGTKRDKSSNSKKCKLDQAEVDVDKNSNEDISNEKEHDDEFGEDYRDDDDVEDDEEVDEELEDEDDDEDDDEDNARLRRMLSMQMQGLFGAGGGSGLLSSDYSRFKQILNELKNSNDDPTTQLIVLQELAEILSISSEDSLPGYFSIDAFAKELVRIMKGPLEDDMLSMQQSGGDLDQDMMLALYMSEGLSGGNPEIMLLACRCISNLLEAMPTSVTSIVSHGAIRVLCQKLKSIQYIDLAEQALYALEKISAHLPRAVIHEGGLTATLMYFDFFSIHAQRTALRTASNCMRGLDLDSFPQVVEVVPILMNTITYSDRSVVELSCLCWVRIAEGYRSHRVSFERAITADLLEKLYGLMPVPGNTNAVHPGTFQDLLRIFRAVSKASPQLSFELLKLGIVNSFYQILIGSAAIPDLTKIASAAQSQQHITLDSKWRDSVALIMKIIVDLLPPLPKDDMFSSRRFKQQQQQQQSSTPTCNVTTRSMSAAAVPTITKNNEKKEIADLLKDDPRVKWLQDDQTVMMNMDIVLIPLLLDMYSSTVNIRVRQLVTHALVKLFHYSQSETLSTVLKCVGLSSFLSGILVRQEHPVLIVDALYQAEILIKKLPLIYQESFEREGVLHEIVAISKLPLTDDQQQCKDSSASERSEAGTLPQRSSTIKVGANDDLSQSTQLSFDESDEAATTTDAQGRIDENEPVTDDEKEPKSGESKNTSNTADNSTSAAPTSVMEQRGRLNGLLMRTQRLLEQHQLHSSTSSRASHHHHNSDTEKGIGHGSTRKYIILLCQYFVKHYIKMEESSGHVKSTNNSFKEISQFAAELSTTTTKAQSYETLRALSRYLQKSSMGISSFELINTGLLKALLSYLTAKDDDALSLSLRERIQLFQAVLMEEPDIDTATQSSSLRKLVTRLQEILSRSESFEVVSPLETTSSDNLRNPTSMLAKQLRLRLSGVGDHIPGTYKQLMVSTHAVATFKILEEYLLARIQASSLLLDNDESNSENEEEIEDHLSFDNDEDDDDGMDIDDDEEEGDTVMRETILVDKKETEEEGDESSKSTDKSGSAAASSSSTVAENSNTGSSSGAGNAHKKDQQGDDCNKALKKGEKKDGKWRIRFIVDGTPISNDSTVYAAVHQLAINKKTETQQQQQEAANSGIPSSSSRNIWTSSHPVTYERYWEPASESKRSSNSKSEKQPQNKESNAFLPKELQQQENESNICHQVLCLLQAVFSAIDEKRSNGITAEDFVNRKLTAKANRQLEEPLIVASSCLPSWIYWLMDQTPFLFPFETRYLFIQSTSFGYTRLIARWQSLQMRNQNSQNHHNRNVNDEQQPILGRMERQKVRIARSHILESAVKVIDMFGSSPSVLEFEYMGEEGTGLGPTLEFYACCSKEFTKRSLNMWRGSNTSNGDYVDASFGLFPKTLSKNIGKSSKKIISLFKTLGQFIAKGLLDFRIIDIPFSPAFFKVVLNNAEPSAELLMEIDPQLAKSIRSLSAYAERKREIYDDTSITSFEDKLAAINDIEIDGAKIEDMCLDFTLVGDAAFELKPGGADIGVTIHNVEEYIELLLDAIAGSGISEQVKAFTEGFNGLFPIEDLKLLTCAELVSLFGGNGQDNDDWSYSTLSDTIRADHGFTKESKPVRYLLEILSELSPLERRHFLQFTTGSPRLPIGGWKALRPTFTVVRKIPEAPFTPDDYLPSVMTCANYLKMPAYTSKEITYQKLITAMKEGQNSFLLS